MNCLAHALNAWHTEGGYLVLRKSAARAWPHVMHIGDEGLQHFSPGAPLGHPVHALIGFYERYVRTLFTRYRGKV